MSKNPIMASLFPVDGEFERRAQRWVVAGECSGECCRMMTLNIEPELVAAIAARDRYDRSLIQPKPATTASDESSAFFFDEDGLSWRQRSLLRGPSDAEYVEANWIPVRKSWFHGTTGERNNPGPAPRMQYRCKQWDGRRCMDYANRPSLCRTFGVERHQICERKGCTLRPFHVGLDHDRWADDGGASVPGEV